MTGYERLLIGVVVAILALLFLRPIVLAAGRNFAATFFPKEGSDPKKESAEKYRW